MLVRCETNSHDAVKGEVGKCQEHEHEVEQKLFCIREEGEKNHNIISVKFEILWKKKKRLKVFLVR